MSGWKTWAATAAMTILGILDISNGDIPGGITKITGALGLVGLGHKIEKTAGN